MIVRSLNAFIQLYRVQSLFWNKQSPEDIDTNMVLEATAPCAGPQILGFYYLNFIDFCFFLAERTKECRQWGQTAAAARSNSQNLWKRWESPRRFLTSPRWSKSQNRQKTSSRIWTILFPISSLRPPRNCIKTVSCLEPTCFESLFALKTVLN